MRITTHKCSQCGFVYDHKNIYATEEQLFIPFLLATKRSCKVRIYAGMYRLNMKRLKFRYNADKRKEKI